MEQSESDKMTPLDRIISSRQLQMLKLMIPYTPPSSQRMLAIYAKFLELQHTISFFQSFHKDIRTQAFQKTLSSPLDIFDELRPYMPENERNSIDSILNVLNMMEMVSAMEQMNSDGDGHPGTGGFNPMDMMKGMLTPEQQGMFDMYSTMFNEMESQDSDVKGDDDNNG